MRGLYGRFNFAADEVLEERRAARAKLAPEDRVTLDWRLIEAAKSGRTRERLIPALHSGANVNAIDGLKLTPLMWSTLGRFTAGIYSLLEARADPLVKSPVVVRDRTFVTISPDDPLQENDVPLTAPLMAVVTGEENSITAFISARTAIPGPWHKTFRDFTIPRTKLSVERLLSLTS